MLREVQRYQAQAAQAQQELHRLRTVLASSERGSMSSGGGSMSLGASMSIPLSGMGSLPLVSRGLAGCLKEGGLHGLGFGTLSYYDGHR